MAHRNLLAPLTLLTVLAVLCCTSATAAAQSPVLSSCTEGEILANAAPNARVFIERALDWVHRGVPYCQCVTGDGGPYRTDCSGLVAMSWNLPAPGNTTYSYAGGEIDNGLSRGLGSWDEITIGDATNYPGSISAHTGHIRLFAGWLDAAHSQYCSIEEYSTGHPAEIRSHTLDTSIYIPIRLSGWEPEFDRAPTGWIDAAACTSASGWAQDADLPDTAIAVHLYFDGQAGDPAATGFATTAGNHRDDVGDHGFAFVVPNRFRDGRDHPVYAYGIDANGSSNALLMGSPATFHCDAPASPFPHGVRREVSAKALEAWQFAANDITPVDGVALSQWPLSDPWPEGAQLVGASGGGAVYVRDEQLGEATRRRVPTSAAMQSWQLDAGAVTVVASADLSAMAAGADLSDAPYVVTSGGVVYVVDAWPDAHAPERGAIDSGTPPAATMTGDPGPHTSRITGGCSVGGGGGGSSGSGGGAAWLALCGVVLVVSARARGRGAARGRSTRC